MENFVYYKLFTKQVFYLQEEFLIKKSIDYDIEIDHACACGNAGGFCCRYVLRYLKMLHKK